MSYHALSFLCLALFWTALSSSPAKPRSQTGFTRISLPAGSPLPVETAAKELAAKTGAAVVREDSASARMSETIALVLGERIRAHPEAASLLASDASGREWEIVKRSGGGLIIAGSSPRNVCRAALGWIEDPLRETDRLSTFDFAERFTMWDNALNQWYRFSRGFDRRKHFRVIARLGHTGAEVNRYADAEGYWVKHRKFKTDSYAWYMSYAPALDAYVETSLTRGLYPAKELAANLADLRESARIAREFGLKPGFVCYEPRAVPEAVFDRHPELRGARTDHPGRSLEPRFSLDIANPRVLEHYSEAVSRLMREVPDLRYLVFWTQDSGSGIPFTRGLYPGPNGSYRARASTVGRMVSDFARALLEGGRRVNPEFEVIMQMGWEYMNDERREIIRLLPRSVTASHDLGGRALTGGAAGFGATQIAESRNAGLDPYASIAVSSSWEAEPIIGIFRASAALQRFAHLRRLKVRHIFTQGGVVSQTPYDLAQELYAELIRGEVPNPEAFFFEIALRWCEGDRQAASLLVRAWKIVDDAIGRLDLLNWYHAGAGQTQGRWLTRPIVPDITVLSVRERAAWERELFGLPSDIGRQNISFEGGIRMYSEEQLEQATRNYDSEVIPGLEKAVELLDRAIRESGSKAVLVDQRDRLLAYLLSARTVRNLFDSQAAVNHLLLKRGDSNAHHRRLNAAIEGEIQNTERWIQLLADTKTLIFRMSAGRETPFLYKTPLEDMKLKLDVMRRHRGDRPGPFLKQLTEPHSARRLLFYGDP